MSARPEWQPFSEGALRQIQSALVWIGALWVAVVPGVIALDHGGALPWSYWGAAAAAGIPAIGAWAALSQRGFSSGIQPHLLTILLLVMAAFALMQTIPLPSGIVAWLSPGSYAAWSQWLPESARGADALGDEQSMPISVAPYLSTQSAAILATMAIFAWCGSLLFNTRERIAWLLIALAVMGAVHSVAGFWQLFTAPNRTIWDVEAGHPFGTFVNRNNAAVLLNLSLASALGLIGWRLAAVTGHEFGQRQFSFSSLLDLVSDQIALLALVVCIINVAALLAGGSRAGLAGSVLGAGLALGLLRQSHIAHRLMWAVAISSLVAFLLLARADVSPRTLDRFGASAAGIAESVLSDQRLPHWRDSFAAASHYLPLGCGLGTYRYGYLPYEHAGSNLWFRNADNLWLEWLLEAGLVGVFGVLAVVAVVTYALLQLRQTPDPMDHGLATAGWFALGSLGLSQSFDFGLLLAGSAAACSLLFGTILARAATEGIPLWRPERVAGRRLQFQSPIPGWALPLFAVSLLAVHGASLWQLRRAAFDDAAIRTAGLASASDFEALEGAERFIDAALQSNPTSAALWYARAGLDLRRAQRDAANRMAKSPLGSSASATSELGSLSQLNGLAAIARRMTVSHPAGAESLRQWVAEARTAASEHHARARADSLRALANSPLMPEPRLLLLRLETQVPPGAEFDVLAGQFLRLRRGATVSLQGLARAAAAVDHWDIATAAWKRLSALHPDSTGRYLAAAEEAGHPRPLTIVPARLLALESATRHELAKDAPDLEFLIAAQEELSANLPADRGARAQRYALLARVEAVRGRVPEQLALHQKAVSTDGHSRELRLQYSEALAAAGQLNRAKLVARDAEQELGDPRGQFRAFIERIESSIEPAGFP